MPRRFTELGTVPMQKLPIIFAPELLAASMQARELDLFAVWTVCRAIDVHLGGQGVMKVQTIRWVCDLILGITEKYAYEKFKEGIGIYWHAPNGARGKQTTGLISAKKVTERLAPTMARTRPFVITLQQIVTEVTDKGWAPTRSLLFGMVAAAAEASKPIANATLQEQTGFSRASVKRLRRACPHLMTIRNFCTVAKCNTEADAIGIRSRLISIGMPGANPFRIIRAGAKFLILRQLGNAYALTELSRLPLRHRLKSLRPMDAHNAAVCQPRRFLESPKAKTSASEYFTPSDSSLKGILSRARLWDRHGPPISEDVLTVPARQKAGERWSYYKRYINRCSVFDR